MAEEEDKTKGGELLVEMWSDEDEDGLDGADTGVAGDQEDEELNNARGFTTADLRACERVIGALANDLDAYLDPMYRELRKRIQPIVVADQRRYFKGMSEADRKARNAYKMKKAALDRKVINSKRLRQHRIQALKQLQEKASALGIEASIAVPDGAATHDPLALEAPRPTDQDDDDGDGCDGGESRDLETIILSCYICKMRFSRLHHFYSQLCPTCAALNFEKRSFLVSLDGRYAIVTGGRVKIGFQIGLKLLRAGAAVVVTSRFPRDAFARYEKEKDFTTWGDRLHVYGVDLRMLPHVESFCDWFMTEFPCLDVIINNACQTIRRPPTYYKRLIVGELTAPHAPPKQVHLPTSQPSSTTTPSPSTPATAMTTVTAPAAGSGRDVPAYIAPLASQLAAEHHAHAQHDSDNNNNNNSYNGDGADNSSNDNSTGSGNDSVAAKANLSQLFPQGLEDVNEQQIDLRDTNSWLLKIGQVTTPEMIEVNACASAVAMSAITVMAIMVMSVNAISPFIINGRLQDHLLKSKHSDRYIVNVSAMEGKFYRYKTPNHPHTNMAKAALNMMTRTSAADLAKKGIYMTAVDTGWINDENPVARAARIAQAHNFQTPIDEVQRDNVDAAARVVDPVFMGVQGRASDPSFEPMHGIFLKDYQETEW
ncbi:short chain dehydrogenase/reductase family Oxidoreductase [Salpingoeca rosetta]|uniref:Short chain dehydrogenase/reductase family Oxidoreductase n=1 Tax=Salpingoeca rosetta (strain ATCC 50818 / BSB-021) TaxID=946362 RepID=F2UII0_SALR5|nr:short chain dehydrogenase/reductase family Oxidoreductase [Salpingoeca rosetta]EGD77029.1 short chain dehydrogenase/reductase family Oxidoreductase [Salpingoeca rosetta]|eukprot:XP_004990869.1 short chain dehydrogenase/reductase family Oxidoreductase [Salpingoeca rosetta]